jgi:hypothetical protein
MFAQRFGRRRRQMVTVMTDDLSLGTGDGPSDPAQAAAYVAELSADLATLARRHGLDALGYILDMARLEAENATRHMDGRR